MLDLLKFDITAQDRTAAAFGKVKSELKGIRGALAGINDHARRAGRSMRNIGAGLSAGVTAPLMLLGKQSVTLYDTQVKAEAKVAAAIKSTGGAAGLTATQLKGMAGALQGVTTFGDEDILANVTAPLLTFTKIQGDAFGRAQANVLDMATLLKMDLRSASVLVGKALNDPVKGITALGRSGVQFTDSQKDVIKALVETGDVAGAQAIILKELETQFKGQAEAAANTPLGQWQQLSNAIGDVKEELGKEVVPFLKPLLEQVKAAVQWFAELSPEVKRTSVIVGGLAAVVGPVVGVLGLATIGVAGLAGAVTTLGTALMANPIGLAIAVIAGGAYLIYRNWEGLSGWFRGMWDAVSGIFSRAWEGLKSLLLNYTAAGLIYQNWDGIAGWFGLLWSSVSAGLEIAWDGIKGLLSGQYSPRELIYNAWQGIGDWFRGLKPALLQAFSDLWSGIAAEVGAWPGRMLQIGKDMVAQLFAGFGSERVDEKARAYWDRQFGDAAAGKNPFMGVGGDAVGGLGKGISGALPDVEAMGREIGDYLEKGASDRLQRKSPSRVFMGVGRDVVDGLGVGLAANRDLALDEMKGIAGALTDIGSAAASQMAPMVSGALNAVIDGSKSASDALGDLARQIQRMAVDRSVQRLFEMFDGKGASGGGGGGGGWLGQIFGGLFGGGRSVVPAAPYGGGISGAGGLYAKGGVFSGGSEVTAFARGGVVSGATVFPMARGAGLMGEAGPEAILPLRRGQGGRLGVSAPAGGAAQAVRLEITINNTVPGVEVRETRREGGRVDLEVREAMNSVIRGGGLHGAMRDTYGIAPRARGA